MNAEEVQRQQLWDDIQALPNEYLPQALALIGNLRKSAIAKTTSSQVAQPVEPWKPITQSPYEAFRESGLIGYGEGPHDLAANHKAYLAEDFGK